MMNRIFCGFLAAVLATPAAFAQFHRQSQTGQAAFNQQSMDSAAAHFNSQMGTPGGEIGHNGGGSVYLSDANRKNFGASIQEQKDMQIHVWGRAIHHSDDTYTLSQQDNTKDFLEQKTYSKNGTEIQRRSISLDPHGRPDEVMIYGGGDHGKLKYRGKHVYDNHGRFAEEQLFSSTGDLIRRKIQEYTPQGQRMPLRSVDYAENVPQDLQLVIVRESEEQTQVASAEPEPQPQKRGLFNKKNNDKPTQPGNTGALMMGHAAPEQQQAQPAKSKPSIGSNLGRLFSKKK